VIPEQHLKDFGEQEARRSPGGHRAPAALSAPLPEAQRRRLPNRRRNETYDLVVNGSGTKVVATIGFDETGKPAEVFLNAGKVGSAIDALLGDSAVVISIALQHGIAAAALAKSVARMPETLDGPAIRAASPIGAALDLLAEIENRISV
jgi:hypothetical protein